jgi:hypothetical protein
LSSGAINSANLPALGKSVVIAHGCPDSPVRGPVVVSPLARIALFVKEVPMAQKVNIVLVDDLDGSDATQTVSFGLDGASYEIDLNDKNAATLREALAGYVGVGRKVSGGGARRGRRNAASATALGPSSKQIRDWARSNGYDVSDRGRVSAEVRQAFDAAH